MKLLPSLCVSTFLSLSLLHSLTYSQDFHARRALKVSSKFPPSRLFAIWVKSIKKLAINFHFYCFTKSRNLLLTLFSFHSRSLSLSSASKVSVCRAFIARASVAFLFENFSLHSIRIVCVHIKSPLESEWTWKFRKIPMKYIKKHEAPLRIALNINWMCF